MFKTGFHECGRFRRPFQGLAPTWALSTQGSLRFALGFIPSSAPRTTEDPCGSHGIFAGREEIDRLHYSEVLDYFSVEIKSTS